MKVKLLFVWAFILPLVSFSQDWTTQVGCPNSPVVYNPFYDDDGDFIIPYQLSPPYAVYTTGSTSVPQYLFNNNGSNNQYWGYNSLSVTWPNAGKGLINATAASSENPDGWYAQINVNIGSQPIFTSSPPVLCHGQSGTFQVSDVCGSSYVWSAPSGWTINGGSNTLTTSSKSVSITAPATGTGNAQITVTSNANYNGAVTANVWLGSPSGPGALSPSLNPMCPGQVKNTSFSAPGGATSIDAYAITSNLEVGSASSTLMIVEAYTPGSGSIKYVSTNACGSKETTYPILVKNYGAVGCGGSMMVNVSPNPASEELVLTNLAEEDYQLNITDANQHSWLRKEVTEKTSRISLEGFKPGIYYVVINSKSGSATERIVIK